MYEDAHVIVFDKPSGLLSVPSPKKETHTLVTRVNEQFSSKRVRLFPCHRLDRDTSGAILFAKDRKTLGGIIEAFRQHRIAKKYIAFVRGRPQPASGEIKIPIKDFHQKRFHQGGPDQSALTRYRTKGTRQKFSVLEVEPVTGRTNQIRIHFSKIGHPLLGERLYAFGKDFDIKFRRVALHSAEIIFPHPATNKPIQVACELAEDMRKFLEKN